MSCCHIGDAMLAFHQPAAHSLNIYMDHPYTTKGVPCSVACLNRAKRRLFALCQKGICPVTLKTNGPCRYWFHPDSTLTLARSRYFAEWRGCRTGVIGHWGWISVCRQYLRKNGYFWRGPFLRCQRWNVYYVWWVCGEWTPLPVALRLLSKCG